MLVPASSVVGMFIGAAIDFVWRRVNPKSAENYSIPVASGFIAGEALVAVILPVLITLKILSP
jgi:uncharacterized oligopeptide transporter (OPT) family protein